MDALREILEAIEVSAPLATDELLRRVLLKSRQVTGAEAGTIFVARGRGRTRRLEAADAQNDIVALEPKEIVVPVSMESIAGYTAATGETVFVDDLYEIPDSLPYTFDPSIDRALGYRCRTMLSFPLLNGARKVIGVVQLINRRDGEGRGPLPFDRTQADLIVPVNHIVGSAVERATMMERIAAQNVSLRQRNTQLKRHRERIEALQGETEEAFLLSINLLARAAELHDENTARHVERVNEYSHAVAEILGQPESYRDEIRYSAQLHDVGKMSVNVAILRKEGPLDDAERSEMMRHPIYGYQILSASERLQMAAQIALNHHERWDGSGYPHGRSEFEIPLAARIVSLADIYDALRSSRPYKKGFSHDRARTIILEGDDRLDAEGHLDPHLVELFAEHHEVFDQIWERLAD
jgi:HD-GYP domain-containing protein (c-di-GMP phosphodiesterase class II)